MAWSLIIVSHRNATQFFGGQSKFVDASKISKTQQIVFSAVRI
jgi:hypothetical protein